MRPVNVSMSSPHHPNSVSILREQELAKSQRVFQARGSRAIRCPICLLTRHNCICAERPSVNSDCAFCFIMYKGEAYKPSNTGRLIADVVADNHAFLWERTVHNPDLLALLNDTKYAPIVVFPHQYAEPERCIHQPSELNTAHNGRIPLFIMLDGTWREAKKMFKSPYLANLPVLGIQPVEASGYTLREAAQPHQLCTAEVGIEVLRLACETSAADALQRYFYVFLKRYLAGRANTHKRLPPSMNALDI